jgi:hypothetical protein
MATDSNEDENDQEGRQRAPRAPRAPRRRPGSAYRTVRSQTTQVRQVYRHSLLLECGHVVHRTGGRPGVVLRWAQCLTCVPTPTVEEETKPRGWLERLITGRRDQ